MSEQQIQAHPDYQTQVPFRVRPDAQGDFLWGKKGIVCSYIYSEIWELGTPKGLSKSAVNFEVVLFVLSSSQVVPISQVVLKTGFTVSYMLHPAVPVLCIEGM